MSDAFDVIPYEVCPLLLHGTPICEDSKMPSLWSTIRLRAFESH